MPRYEILGLDSRKGPAWRVAVKNKNFLSKTRDPMSLLQQANFLVGSQGGAEMFKVDGAGKIDPEIAMRSTSNVRERSAPHVLDSILEIA